MLHSFLKEKFKLLQYPQYQSPALKMSFFLGFKLLDCLSSSSASSLFSFISFLFIFFSSFSITFTFSKLL